MPVPVKQCLELSDEEFDALIAQGWSKQGGPYDTEADCITHCNEGTIQSPCCPGRLLPAQLFGTFLNKTGTLTGLPDNIILGEPDFDPWNYTNPVGNTSISVFCAFGGNDCEDWLLADFDNVTLEHVQVAVKPGCSCDPLFLVFDVTTAEGSYTLIVTE